MLKNIKSRYIIKLIFQYVDEKSKLKIVKYNKSFQKNIDISIINFKFFSGRYIIYESNRIGKEYDCYNGKLKFEGEYLNGEKHGKGKEYNDDGKLIFEGEYLNGKRNGKGKEYNSYYGGLLTFIGQYLNDRRWNVLGYRPYKKERCWLKNGKGLIKEYNSINYYLEFEGEYLNGQRNGKGKEFNHLIGTYEGEYLNGKRHGKGKELNKKDELIFEGEYLYGYKLKGKYYKNGKLEYEGEFRYNKKYNGKGYDENGNIIYELNNGNGKVKEYDENEGGDSLFEGEYLNGKRWKGHVTEGDWYGFTGFEGEYLNGQIKEGKEYGGYGELQFEGEYLNGERHGKGKEYDDDILIFEGEYLNGKRHGKGKEYDKNGNLIFEGEYLNNKRV